MSQADPRYLTSKTDDHPLEAVQPKIEGEYAGLPGGPTEEYLLSEDRRLAAEPIGYQGTDYTYNAVADPVNHEVDTSDLHNMEVPRHDRYADENTPGPTPDRVIPGGVTNAHPDYSVRNSGAVVGGHAGLTTTGHMATSGYPTDGEPSEFAAYVTAKAEDGLTVTGDAGEVSGTKDELWALPQNVYEPGAPAPVLASTLVGEAAEPVLEAQAEDAKDAAVTTEVTESEIAVEDDEPDEVVRPAGNASAEAWRAYACSQGMTLDEAEGYSRDELRDMYREVGE